MQQSSATLKNRDVGRELLNPPRSQSLLVSTVFGTVSSLHPTSFFILVLQMFYAFDTRGDDITRTPTYVRIRIAA